MGTLNHTFVSSSTAMTFSSCWYRLVCRNGYHSEARSCSVGRLREDLVGSSLLVALGRCLDQNISDRAFDDEGISYSAL